MSSIGPELPPHLAAKRKREAEEERDKTNRIQQQSSRSPSSDAASDSKRPRVFGPAAPPAPLDHRPSSPPRSTNTDDSSDDEDYGPALPSHDGIGAASENVNYDQFQKAQVAADEEKKKTTQRDEWMLVPPTQDDLSARMDPTKLRARKFNTGKGARGPNSIKDGVNALWTETPEQKRKRLKDEMLGVVQPASTTEKDVPSVAELKRKAEDEATARKIRDHNEKYRKQSLLEQHKSKAATREKEDDPSKRAFDYEKDMAGGGTIGYSQRKEMMKRTADFSSKFTSGSYS